MGEDTFEEKMRQRMGGKRSYEVFLGLKDIRTCWDFVMESGQIVKYFIELFVDCLVL